MSKKSKTIAELTESSRHTFGQSAAKLKKETSIYLLGIKKEFHKRVELEKSKRNLFPVRPLPPSMRTKKEPSPVKSGGFAVDGQSLAHRRTTAIVSRKNNVFNVNPLLKEKVCQILKRSSREKFKKKYRIISDYKIAKTSDRKLPNLNLVSKYAINDVLKSAVWLMPSAEKKLSESNSSFSHVIKTTSSTIFSKDMKNTSLKTLTHRKNSSREMPPSIADSNDLNKIDCKSEQSLPFRSSKMRSTENHVAVFPHQQSLCLYSSNSNLESHPANFQNDKAHLIQSQFNHESLKAFFSSKMSKSTEIRPSSHIANNRSADKLKNGVAISQSFSNNSRDQRRKSIIKHTSSDLEQKKSVSFDESRNVIHMITQEKQELEAIAGDSYHRTIQSFAFDSEFLNIYKFY
jgi:hypothetical protein